MKFPMLRGRSSALLFISAAAFLSMGFFLLPEQKERGEKEEQEDEPMEAIRLEFAKTRDPKLNTIPRERLTAALQFYERQAQLLGQLKTTSGFSSINWTERGPNNVGGRTRAIIFDANDLTNKTVFAGAAGGGLWKCTDITQANPAWVAVNDQFANLAVTTIAQDPSNTQILYFGTGEGYGNADGIKGNGIWKSTDGGSTWTQLSSTNNNNNFSYIQKIIVTANGDVYAGCRGATANTGGLQKSTNGGSTWTRVIGSGSSDMRISDVEVAANGDLYATTGLFTTGKIYKSSVATHGVNVGNSGNWSNITPTGTWARIEIALAPSNSSQIYALCQDGGSYEVTGIYSSTNGGTNWTSKTIPTIYDQGANSFFTRGQAWYDLTCAVDPSTSTTLYIGGVDILKSTNSGTSWTQLTSWSLYGALGSTWNNANVHADIHSFVFRPGTNTTALVGCDGGIFYCTNLTSSPALPTWISKSDNYNVTQYYSCATHPSNVNYFLAGAQDNGSHKFTNAGINAVTDVSGGDGAFCFIDKTNGNNQITSYVYNNYYVSTNGGSSFTYLYYDSDNSGSFVNPSDLDDSSDILYSAAATNYLGMWYNIFDPINEYRSDQYVNLNGEQITSIKVSPNNKNRVYVGTDNGRVYRITNPQTVATVTNLTSTVLVANGYVSSIDIKKRSTGTDDSIVVAISNYGVNSVYYTANGTSNSPTWVDIDDNNTLQDVPVRWAIWSPASSKIIFLGTEVGVMGTGTLNGNSTVWTLLNNNTLPMTRVDMVDVNSNNELVVATHGRGLWTSSDVTPLELKLLSFDVKLQQNTVAVSWKVNTDNQASAYIVERSYDGQIFHTLEEVKPTGSGSYTLQDNSYDRRAAEIFYRLRYEDKTGDRYYSGVKTVRPLTTADVFIAGVFPTVSDGRVHLKVGNMNNLKLQVHVVNPVGKVLYQAVLDYEHADLDLRHLAAGNYIVYITDEKGNHEYFTRIVKQ